ncbi:MAG: ChaN family lipoprotein, partial [Desulfobacterales bacterium]|nr:ChaN family lipoprotein [Desulfobacterales bacterium]
MKSDTVLIKDTSTAVEPDTIISAKTGKTVTFGELMNDLNSSQIVFIGERHTNSTHHEIQLKIIEAVFKNHHSMVVGMEMFDRSYKPVLDLWSGGVLEEEIFLRKVHWYANWRWDFALYRNIFLFIKENRIKIVALNIPHYILSRIRVGGIDNLSDTDKQ